jgi:molybdate transport system regulatory protein
LAIPCGKHKIKYLSSQEIDAFTYTFQNWFDQSLPHGKKRLVRGRYWLVYLLLRFTGARLGAGIQIDDYSNIVFRAAGLP